MTITEIYEEKTYRWKPTGKQVSGKDLLMILYAATYAMPVIDMLVPELVPAILFSVEEVDSGRPAEDMPDAAMQVETDGTFTWYPVIRNADLGVVDLTQFKFPNRESALADATEKAKKANLKRRLDRLAKEHLSRKRKDAKRFSYTAIDDDGWVCAYVERPEKQENQWILFLEHGTWIRLFNSKQEHTELYELDWAESLSELHWEEE